MRRMKCDMCNIEFDKNKLNKCMNGTYKCDSCVAVLMDEYYDSEAEYENNQEASS